MFSISRVNKHVLTFTIISFLMLSMFGVVFDSLHFYAEASNGTVISIVPSVNSANPSPAPVSSQYFTINFTVTNVTFLYAWQIDLKWPVGLLSTAGANISKGPFLSQGGSTTFQKGSNPSSISMSEALLGIKPGVNGSGVLATVIFRVLRPGNCTLEYTKTALSGFTGSGTTFPISHSRVDATFYTTFPVAEFDYLPKYTKEHPEYGGHPIVGEPVAFNGTASYDPDQSYRGQSGSGIVSYSWDFNDTATGTGQTINHTYTRPGTYRVKLTVTDDDGEAFTNDKVAVAVLLHDIAVINVTVSSTQVMAGGTVTINATFLNRGSELEDFNVTAFYNFNPIETKIFTRIELGVEHRGLPSGKNGTLAFDWDTTGVANGSYLMGIYAFLVDPANISNPWIGREINTGDNTRFGDYVTVTIGQISYDVGIKDITVNPSDLKIGESSSIRVTLVNKVTANVNYNLTVTVEYGSETPLVKLWSNKTLNAGATAFQDWTDWIVGTTSTKEGGYKITAKLVPINATTLGFLEKRNATTGELLGYYNASVPDDFPDDNILSKVQTIRVFPTPSFIFSLGELKVDQAVTFNATASVPNPLASLGGAIKLYSWNFGDGTSATQSTPVVSHIYRSNGQFTVTLSVTDDVSLTSDIKKTVMIAPSRNVDIVDTSFSPPVVASGEEVSIDVTVNIRFFTQNFTLTTYFNNDEIGSELNTTLQLGASKTFTFTWTTDVSAGNYTIKAVTTTVLRNATSGTYYTNVEDTFVAGRVVVQKLPVAITLTADKTVLNTGEATTLSGSTTPALPTTALSILYKLNDAVTWSTLPTQVTTNAGGTYSYGWTPPSAGTYTIKVSWAGTNSMTGESEERVIVVSEGGTGLNPFMITTIALIVVLIAVSVYFLRFRKPASAEPSESTKPAE